MLRQGTYYLLRVELQTSSKKSNDRKSKVKLNKKSNCDVKNIFRHHKHVVFTEPSD